MQDNDEDFIDFREIDRESLLYIERQFTLWRIPSFPPIDPLLVRALWRLGVEEQQEISVPP